MIACQAIFNITGGLYDENSNNLIVNDNVWIIKLNQDKKITRWSMVWNPNKDTMLKAMDKAMTKLGKKTPEPNEHPSITLEEGLKYANDFMKALSSGFIKSNHTETLSKLFSDHLSWDLSDGTKVSSNGICFAFLCISDTHQSVTPYSHDRVKDLIKKSWQSFMRIGAQWWIVCSLPILLWQ